MQKLTFILLIFTSSFLVIACANDTLIIKEGIEETSVSELNRAKIPDIVVSKLEDAEQQEEVRKWQTQPFKEQYPKLEYATKNPAYQVSILLRESSFDKFDESLGFVKKMTSERALNHKLNSEILYSFSYLRSGEQILGHSEKKYLWFKIFAAFVAQYLNEKKIGYKFIHYGSYLWLRLSYNRESVVVQIDTEAAPVISVRE